MAKIIGHTDYHHMDQGPDLHGMTIRQALKALRTVDFGNLGGMFSVELSDGTMLEVENTPAHGGGELMSSQRARRYVYENNGEKVIRYYEL